MKGWPCNLRAVKLILLLLAWGAGGAIVNVAVAWGCGFNQRFDRQPSSPAAGDLPRWWSSNVPPTFASAQVPAESFCMNSFGHETIQWPGAQEDVSRFVVQRHRTGWPALAMERSHWIDSVAPLLVHRNAWNSELAGGRFRGLPTRLLWPGFAINTAFYAAMSWLLFAAPFALRRRSRIKRGLCPACGYDLRGGSASGICPECGAATFAP